MEGEGWDLGSIYSIKWGPLEYVWQGPQQCLDNPRSFFLGGNMINWTSIVTVEVPPSSKSNSYLTVPDLILHNCWVDFALPEANIKPPGSTYVSDPWFQIPYFSAWLHHFPSVSSCPPSDHHVQTPLRGANSCAPQASYHISYNIGHQNN